MPGDWRHWRHRRNSPNTSGSLDADTAAGRRCGWPPLRLPNWLVRLGGQGYLTARDRL
jgi:hypothetical protein